MTFESGTWAKRGRRIGRVGRPPAGYPRTPRGFTRVQFVGSLVGEDVRTDGLRQASAAEIARAKRKLAPPAPPRPPRALPLTAWRGAVHIYESVRNEASCLRADPQAAANGSLVRADGLTSRADFVRERALAAVAKADAAALERAFEEARSRTAF